MATSHARLFHGFPRQSWTKEPHERNTLSSGVAWAYSAVTLGSGRKKGRKGRGRNKGGGRGRGRGRGRARFVWIWIRIQVQKE